MHFCVSAFILNKWYEIMIFSRYSCTNLKVCSF